MLIGTLTCDAKKGSDGDGNLSLLRHVELPANCLTLSHLCGLGCMKEESIDGVAGIGCGIYIYVCVCIGIITVKMPGLGCSVRHFVASFN